MMNEPSNNPMDHPAEQPAGSDGAPKFGRLLLVLLVAVLFIVGMTFLSVTIYT